MRTMRLISFYLISISLFCQKKYKYYKNEVDDMTDVRLAKMHSTILDTKSNLFSFDELQVSMSKIEKIHIK